MRFLRALTVAASLVPFASAAVSKISRSGKYLYDDTGSRFYIKVSLLISLLAHQLPSEDAGHSTRLQH